MADTYGKQTVTAVFGGLRCDVCLQLSYVDVVVVFLMDVSELLFRCVISSCKIGFRCGEFCVIFLFVEVSIFRVS